MVIRLPLPTAVNDTERHYFTDCCILFLFLEFSKFTLLGDKISKLHSLFSPSYCLARVKKKKVFF